jgi:hypothetical protein
VNEVLGHLIAQRDAHIRLRMQEPAFMVVTRCEWEALLRDCDPHELRMYVDPYGPKLLGRPLITVDVGDEK